MSVGTYGYIYIYMHTLPIMSLETATSDVGPVTSRGACSCELLQLITTELSPSLSEKRFNVYLIYMYVYIHITTYV